MKPDTINKYLTFLNDLYILTDKADTISLDELTREHKVSKVATTVLIRDGLIRVVGRNGRRRILRWDTIPPTRDMAVELINRVNDNIKASLENYHTNNTKKQTRNIAYKSDVFDSLPKNFTTARVVRELDKHGKDKTTYYQMCQSWIKVGKIVKVSRGSFRKVDEQKPIHKPIEYNATQRDWGCKKEKKRIKPSVKAIPAVITQPKKQVRPRTNIIGINIFGYSFNLSLDKRTE
jgi:hypothetical protein